MATLIVTRFVKSNELTLYVLIRLAVGRRFVVYAPANGSATCRGCTALQFTTLISTMTSRLSISEAVQPRQVALPYECVIDNLFCPWHTLQLLGESKQRHNKTMNLKP